MRFIPLGRSADSGVVDHQRRLDLTTALVLTNGVTFLI